MKITCDSCQSKYTISDEKVQGKTVKIKCRKCGATLVVTSAGVTTNGAAAAAPAASAGGGDGSWLVNVADGDQRTMSLADVIAAYNAGVIDQETYLWSDGMDDWQPLAQVATIVDALHASTANAGATAPQPAMDAGSLFDPTPMSPPVAAAAPQQEERRAAIVRRDGRRGTQDLFGSQTGGEVVTSAPNAFDGGPPMGAEAHGGTQTGATGQRNENSVLFSLAALTKNDGPAPSASASAGSAKKDDSGLIDLKALAASAAGPSMPASSAFSNPLSPLTPFSAPLAPIGLDVLSAPVGSMPPPAASKNKALIFVAAGTLVALVAIFGVFFALRSGDKPPAAAAAPTASTAPTETVATAEPTASAPADTASASAAATASAPVAAKGKTPPAGYKPPPPGPKPPAATTGAAPPATAAPTAKPPPASGKCGCAPNDLMCQMKCSAGR